MDDKSNLMLRSKRHIMFVSFVPARLQPFLTSSDVSTSSRSEYPLDLCTKSESASTNLSKEQIEKRNERVQGLLLLVSPLSLRWVLHVDLLFLEIGSLFSFSFGLSTVARSMRVQLVCGVLIFF